MRLTVLAFLLGIVFLQTCKKERNPVSPPVTIKPDTTSHNFTFVIDTLGKHPDSVWVDPSILWDVWVVNENDVWVVGEINTLDTGFDSLGNFIPPYSAAHWNGEKWEYVRFWDNGWPSHSVITPVFSIWKFSDSEVWLAAGGIFKKKGDRWYLKYKNNPDAGEMVTKLWAASENEIYGVGARGLIVKYDGNSWTRMESGTDVDLLNIWGVKDEQTGQTHVFAAGSRGDRYYGVVLELKDGQWLHRFDEQHPIFGKEDDHTYPLAVWAYKDSVYVSYSGYDSDNVYRHDINNFSNDFTLIHSETIGAVRSIHGNTYNDFFGAGYLDALFHYNGKTIRNFSNIKDVSKYYSVKQYGDYVFICGKNLYTGEAIVISGKRNH